MTTESAAAAREKLSDILELFVREAISRDGEFELNLGQLADAILAAFPQLAPGHTDLMVTPESLDEYMEKNPLPAAPGKDDQSLLISDARARELAVEARQVSGPMAAAVRCLLADRDVLVARETRRATAPGKDVAEAAERERDEARAKCFAACAEIIKAIERAEAAEAVLAAAAAVRNRK